MEEMEKSYRKLHTTTSYSINIKIYKIHPAVSLHSCITLRLHSWSILPEGCYLNKTKINPKRCVAHVSKMSFW